jgi:hypothetical protein
MSAATEHQDTGIVDLSGSMRASASYLEAAVTLTEPQSRLRLRMPPGKPGRAEAVFEGNSWAAKHYWQESPGVVVYEFDEALPAGSITLRIPLAAS